jgi:hypothetical protein
VFNVSFVFRSKTGQFALLSAMIDFDKTYKISKIDGIVPFATLNKNLSKHSSLIGNSLASLQLATMSFIEPTV